MDVFTAITGRRTIHQFQSRAVPREQIERCLEAAVWAPNHKLTEPWRFTVVEGETKERLARLRQKAVAAKWGEDLEGRRGQKAYEQMARVPVVIVAAMERHEDPVRRQEDYAATACAIQNLQLAAWSQGIGVYWGTGPLMKHPELVEMLALPSSQEVMGILFLGYPDKVPEVQRTPYAKVTRWLS